MGERHLCFPAACRQRNLSHTKRTWLQSRPAPMRSTTQVGSWQEQYCSHTGFARSLSCRLIAPSNKRLFETFKLLQVAAASHAAQACARARLTQQEQHQQACCIGHQVATRPSGCCQPWLQAAALALLQLQCEWHCLPAAQCSCQLPVAYSSEAPLRALRGHTCILQIDA
jgi:hypothetical protein